MTVKVTLAGTDNFNQKTIECDTSIVATDDTASEGVKISTSKYGELDQQDIELFKVFPETHTSGTLDMECH